MRPLDVFKDRPGLADKAFRCLKARHFPQGALLQILRPVFRTDAGIGHDLFKRLAFFKQGELGYVVVITGRESVEL
jgi:hypothetical protein